MRILHVEDDEDTRTLVAFILHGEGWQVVSVENATSAIKLAAASGFDLYLIDNWIEGNTENALCRDLRSLDPRILAFLRISSLLEANYFGDIVNHLCHGFQVESIQHRRITIEILDPM